MRLIFITILFSFYYLTTFSQGFNNAFIFNHRLVVLSAVEELPDSSYFICGHYLNQENDRLGSLYFKLDQEGNLIDSLQVAQLGRSYLLGFARNELFFNHSGNIVVGFRNAFSGELWRQRIQEVNFTDLTLVSDVLLDTLAEHLNLRVFDGSMIIQNKFDSTYLMFITTVDTSYTIGEPGWAGCNLIHLSSNFQILNIKRYFVNIAGWGIGAKEIIQVSENEFILLMVKYLESGTPSQRTWHTIIKKVNAQGDELWSWESMDNQSDIGQRGLTLTDDGGFLYTYLKGFFISNGWSYIPTVRKIKLHPQTQVEEWSIALGGVTTGNSSTSVFSDIESINDTLFVTAGGTFDSNDMYQHGGRLVQFTLNGAKIWQRDFFYFAHDYPNHWAMHGINDIALTSDGGYIMAGTAVSSEIAGVPDYGWVVKLNCLGFMGAPEAAANYAIQDNFAVQFVNISTQGGSYTWNFGDGTVLETGENADTVVHHYNGFGTYMVQLIAHGCNGETDTLEFLVSPKLHANPDPVTEGEGYFTFFPNPVVSGNPFYVYLNGISTHNGKEVKLRFHNNSGQHVTDYRLSNQQGAYMINPTLASGVYHVGLYVGDEVVQVRKLVVD